VETPLPGSFDGHPSRGGRRALQGLPEPVTVRVPAKINLHLAVGPRRDDGYHELTTVYQAVSLHDDITASSFSGLRVTMRGEGADAVPTDDSNLAVRAAQALAAYAGVEPAVHLEILKGIPVAGGMAGGSADAAGALLACDALWGTRLERAQLVEVAAGLGSDVPFCLLGGTALGTGRGEQLTQVLAKGSYHWVLALAESGLSTPAVYAELDRLRASSDPRLAPASDRVLTALRRGSPAELGRALTNDLQAAALALRPQLRLVLEAGRDLGALGAAVSGSGPTCAFLVASGEDAVALAAALAGAGVCRTVRRAHGPVGGARTIPAERA